MCFKVCELYPILYDTLYENRNAAFKGEIDTIFDAMNHEIKY